MEPLPFQPEFNHNGTENILGFFRDQRQVIPPVVKADLSGKTVVVVGANVDLGFEAAKHFATMNPERLISDSFWHVEIKQREMRQSLVRSISFSSPVFLIRQCI